MMAATGITTHKSVRAAHKFLSDNDYDRVRQFWLKNDRCARVVKLPSGKVRVIEGMPA